MNLMTLTAGQPLTMSSREISELCDKRHDNVMRDIRIMLVELYGEGGVLKFEGTHRNPQNGQEYPIFQLPKDLTLTLVAGYNVKLRKRIIDRWMALEESASKPRELSRLELLQIAIDSEEKRIQAEQKNLLLEHKVAEQAPKVQALDRIATPSEGSFCIREAAKMLQVREKLLYQTLIERGWIYRHPLGKAWLAYAPTLQKGLMEHKYSDGEKQDGSKWQSTQARVTARGLAKLALILSAASAANTDTIKASA